MKIKDEKLITSEWIAIAKKVSDLTENFIKSLEKDILSAHDIFCTK